MPRFSSSVSVRNRRVAAAIVLAAVTVLVCVLAANWWPWWMKPTQIPRTRDELAAWAHLHGGPKVRDAIDLLGAGRPLAALRLLEATPSTGPHDDAAAVAAALCLLQQQNWQDAVRRLRTVPVGSPAFCAARLLAARVALTRLKQLSEAEQDAEHVLRGLPDQKTGPRVAAVSEQPAGAAFADLEREARKLLVYVRVITGRHWDAQSHLFALVRNGWESLDELTWLGVPEAVVEDRALLEAAARAGDPLGLLGLAVLDLRDRDRASAEKRLRRALAENADCMEIRARLLRLLAERGPADEFELWNRSVSASGGDRHPGVWIARGLRAERRAEWLRAAECFVRAARLQPNAQWPFVRLASILRRLGQTDAADLCARRAERLIAFADAVHVVVEAPTDGRAMRRAAELAETLGRLWEARAWCRHALRAGASAAWGRRFLDRVERRLGPSTPLTAVPELPELPPELSDAGRPVADAGVSPRGAAASPTNDEGMSRVPVVSRAVSVSHPAGVGASRESPRRFAFRDEAHRVGLDFTYFNGSPPDAQRHLLFEFTGGGVGVVDFDRDGRPDLYFAQGSPLGSSAPGASVEPPTDRLFRNRPAGRFEDVTGASGIGQGGFGQGVAVGDFDNDGFPDIYVANIGMNRLLQNNGDGTFTDRGPLPGDAGRWTTSCLLADLNGDGATDVYDVNYLGGEDVFERVCYNGPHARTCPPRFFEAAGDQLYLNAGDGAFLEASEQAGIVVPDGKGLGVLAFDGDRDGRLELFVANDQVPNFFFVPEASAERGTVRFREQAFAFGLAVDGQGRPNACMGVAFADADGDGWFDLFVTNFSREANVLYRGTAAGVFEDASNAAGLADPGFRWLGFGTQFLDADADGDADLIVLNGHVDDFRFQGTPFAMPPQLFQNVGEGRFVEVPPEQAGPFFEEERVGRALARLDWNGDGRWDLVGTFLHAPAALITNATQPVGHVFALRLVGLHCARDAIGTTVTVRLGEHVWHDQLVGGDGYMASNERAIVFGLGPGDRVDHLTVRWPCGRVQNFANLAADRLWLLVESARRPVSLHTFPSPQTPAPQPAAASSGTRDEQ